MSKLEITLRLLTGLVIVLSVVLVGYMARSPWTILVLGAVFTVLYLLGKRASFSSLHTPQTLIQDFAVTMAVQTLLCGVFYLIGRGIGSFWGGRAMATFSMTDVYVAFGLMLFGVVTTLSLQRLAKIAHVEPLSHASASDDAYTSDYVLRFDVGPISLENFYESVYYDHLERDETGKIVKSDSLPDAAKPSSQLLAETEARLGVVFPPLLKQLYMRQNGGDVGNLWVPCVAQPSHNYDDWRGVFSHDYCYLAPLQQLCTLYDSYLDYMDEDEIAQNPHLETHAKDYVILCQRYADTTFLDYSQSRHEPRVGIVDFEGLNEKNVWFDSFEAFFASLKRGELVDRT